jgi:hypothetical protein
MPYMDLNIEKENGIDYVFGNESLAKIITGVIFIY